MGQLLDLVALEPGFDGAGEKSSTGVRLMLRLPDRVLVVSNRFYRIVGWEKNWQIHITFSEF